MNAGQRPSGLVCSRGVPIRRGSLSPLNTICTRTPTRIIHGATCEGFAREKCHTRLRRPASVLTSGWPHRFRASLPRAHSSGERRQQTLLAPTVDSIVHPHLGIHAVREARLAQPDGAGQHRSLTVAEQEVRKRAGLSQEPADVLRCFQLICLHYLLPDAFAFQDRGLHRQRLMSCGRDAKDARKMGPHVGPTIDVAIGDVEDRPRGMSINGLVRDRPITSHPLAAIWPAPACATKPEAPAITT